MITIAGAGLAGLCTAYELATKGARVRVFDPGRDPATSSVARYAGGMLAPWCERESAEPAVVTLGAQSADWWARITPVTRRGTLVVAPPRDRAELARFSRRTTQHRMLEQDEIATLEPDLAGRFGQGLFFEQEAHLDPRRALRDLADRVRALGVKLCLGEPAPRDVDLDCTGMAAKLPGLRPVRGEMALLHCPELTISRTLRLLHPRFPLYLVPRDKHVYMIGATMVESSSDRPPTLRSLTELFSAAFALHPAFGEASVIETGAGLRPAFADNLPRLVHHDGRLHLNGFFRHGFLLAPALAAQAASRLLQERKDEDLGQRASA